MAIILLLPHCGGPGNVASGSVRGQLHFLESPQIYATVPYIKTDKDEGGSCERFMDLPRIPYGALW